MCHLGVWLVSLRGEGGHHSGMMSCDHDGKKVTQHLAKSMVLGRGKLGAPQETAKNSSATDFNTGGQQDSSNQTHPPKETEATRAQRPPVTPLCFMVSYVLDAILQS